MTRAHGSYSAACEPQKKKTVPEKGKEKFLPRQLNVTAEAEGGKARRISEKGQKSAGGRNASQPWLRHETPMPRTIG
jgi:hypothetical protein